MGLRKCQVVAEPTMPIRGSHDLAHLAGLRTAQLAQVKLTRGLPTSPVLTARDLPGMQPTRRETSSPPYRGSVCMEFGIEEVTAQPNSRSHPPCLQWGR